MSGRLQGEGGGDGANVGGGPMGLKWSWKGNRRHCSCVGVDNDMPMLSWS